MLKGKYLELKSQVTAPEKKAFALDIKADSISEDGSFEGYASVFGNVDNSNEVVVKGAFKRSLDHWATKNKPIPILWQHDPDRPIGYTTSIEEDEKGLKVKGVLLINEVQQAKEAYALAKAGVLGGMSIGYQTKKDEWKGNVRYLKELRLFEYSLVTFPCNEEATVDEMKMAFKAVDFEQAMSSPEITIRQLWSSRWHIEDAFSMALSSIFDSQDQLTAEQKLNVLSESADQYKQALMSWASKMLAAKGFKDAGLELETKQEFLSAKDLMDTKAGKVLSSAHLKLVQDCITTLQALEAAANKDADSGTKSDDNAGNEPPNGDTELSAHSIASVMADIEKSAKSYTLMKEIASFKNERGI